VLLGFSFHKRKVKYILVGKENIKPKAIQTALIIMPVTPKDSIYPSDFKILIQDY
jgi:hypothetical protein